MTDPRSTALPPPVRPASPARRRAALAGRPRARRPGGRAFREGGPARSPRARPAGRRADPPRRSTRARLARARTRPPTAPTAAARTGRRSPASPASPSWPTARRRAAAPTAGTSTRRSATSSPAPTPPASSPARRPRTTRCTATASPPSSWPRPTACPGGPSCGPVLERAIRLIIDTQNEEGGWRYQPVRDDADLSVTICQINALRAARNAGLFVPKETVEACIDYVKQAQNPDGGFRYMLRGGSSAFPRSAAGIVALYSAAVYDDDAVDDGIAYLKQHRPDDRFLRRLPHYFYGHYYAAQAMWIRGGDDWNGWYPGHPRRAAPRPGARRLLGRRLRPGLRHRDGPDHPPDPVHLPADLPALSVLAREFLDPNRRPHP